jgi:hypothetical protein
MTHVSEKCVELLFNLDELGSADWEDREVRKVIVPAGLHKEDAYYPVSRHPAI